MDGLHSVLNRTRTLTAVVSGAGFALYLQFRKTDWNQFHDVVILLSEPSAVICSSTLKYIKSNISLQNLQLADANQWPNSQELRLLSTETEHIRYYSFEWFYLSLLRTFLTSSIRVAYSTMTHSALPINTLKEIYNKKVIYFVRVLKTSF